MYPSVNSTYERTSNSRSQITMVIKQKQRGNIIKKQYLSDHPRHVEAISNGSNHPTHIIADYINVIC